MKEENNDIAIKVNHVYKSFNVYYDRANTLKERLLFIGRNKKREKREIMIKLFNHLFVIHKLF